MEKGKEEERDGEGDKEGRDGRKGREGGGEGMRYSRQQTAPIQGPF